MCCSHPNNHLKKKKRKQINICEHNHLSFTPLVMSVDKIFPPKTNKCFS